MTNPIFESLYSEELYRPVQKTSVVIATGWTEIAEEERQLLTKILESVKLGLESVRIVEQSVFNLSTWSEKPKQLICFSPASKALPKHEIIKLDDTSIVLSNSLAELISDDVAKRKLWWALKELFLT
ncbi:MAG: DNA polymerase III subunit psi [Bacteroidia bacterium]|nr:DNA polymerase III subunit psi [Bacteroidia bacterium]